MFNMTYILRTSTSKNRFLRIFSQISILGQLSHPNIVGILGTIGGANYCAPASSLVLGETCYFPGLVLGECLAEYLSIVF